MLNLFRRAALAAALALVPAVAGAQEVKSAFASADPDAIAAEGKFWIYPTDTGKGDKLFVWSSPDMASWTEGPQLLAMKDIGWIRDDREPTHFLWAPDMVPANGHYYLYYSVGPQNPTPSRLGVAVCEHPAGPCVDSGKPLLTGDKHFEALDPTVFIDPKTQTPYLYAGGSAGSTLHVYVLKPDLVTIDHEVQVDQPPHFTEGVFMHYRKGIYYLSWSSGHWNMADYSVHYAVSLSPTGPWRYAGPILIGDKKYKGPGHHSFLQDPRDGSWWIVYHRWEGKKGDGPYTGDRRVAVQKIEYTDSGLIQPIKMSGD